MGHVGELTDEIHRLLESNKMEEAHRLTTAANGLMLTVLCHELLDDELDGLTGELFGSQITQ